MRPGKMSDMPGAMPIETLPADDTGARVTPADGSVETALYRSSSEELDDVVWKIKTEHLQRSRVWERHGRDRARQCHRARIRRAVAR